jgi:hypothetical protein
MRSRLTWLFATVVCFVIAIFFVAISADASARRLVETGSLDTSGFDDVTRQALGFSATPLADRCAVVVARTGNRAWVLEWNTTGVSVKPEPVDRLVLAPFSRASCRANSRRPATYKASGPP